MSSKDYIYCYQGSALRVAGSTAVVGLKYDKYNPLNLPYYTIRIKFYQGYTPPQYFGGGEWTLVDPIENIWDGSYNEGRKQFPSLQLSSDIQACISANMRTETGFVTSLQNRFNACTGIQSVSLPCTDKVTNMKGMLSHCTELTTIPLFDTSSCTNMQEMFRGCSSLTSITLLNTSLCTNMSSMFKDCYNVQSGALAFYQQASTQETPPSSHSRCFENCGRDTVTGAAELAQIPTSWGGTMA